MNLDINMIHPHPKNPREDLGDLDELVQSIKAHGIMQNLTVVKDPGEEMSFTVIIGHRRLEAAKRAGLKTVPVNLALNLTEQDIQEIMLIENVQREDLTPLEEAKGIQMCLDLGIDESRLSEKTGMSKATIKRRKVLLNYDNDVVKKSFASGATMQDYIDLEQVNDPATREMLAENYLGTADFKYQLKKVLDNEKLKKWQDAAVAEISKWASPLEPGQRNGLSMSRYIANYSKDKLKKPDDADSGDQYFYKVEPWSIGIYAKYADPSKHASPGYVKTKEDLKREKAKAALEKVSTIAKELRAKYMLSLNNYQVKDQHKFKKEAFAFAVKNTCIYNSGINREDFYGITKQKKGDIVQFPTDVEDYFSGLYDRNPLYASLLSEYLILENNVGDTFDWDGRYAESRALPLKRLYQFLEGIDYVVSNDERMLLDGTHPDYVQRKKKAEEDNGQ